MGEIKRTRYVLEVEDLGRVEMGSLTTGELIDLDDADNLAAITLFASKLSDWDLTEDGEPIPANLDGVRCLEPGMVMRMIRAWRDAIVGASDPFDESTLSGTPNTPPGS